MDPAASAAAKAAVEANVPTRQNGVANTFAIVRPGHDGHEVVAMVANRNYGTDAAQGERATDIVADPSNVFGAGSSFKIFTTAAALENGTVGFDSTLPNPGSDCFTPPNANRYTSCYPVANDGTSYPDPISLQDALATSPNVAFVGLESRTGLPAVLAMAQRLGLRESLASNDAGGTPVTDPADPQSKNPQYNQPQSRYFQNLLSFTLGVSPVSTLEMANVAATIESDGMWCPPNPIQSVTDRDGHPVAVAQQACEQVVAPGLAHTLAAGLSQDTISGTSAAAARDAGWTRPDIGKTGTTNASESVAYVGGVGGLTGYARVVDGLRRRHPPAGDLPRHPRAPRRLRARRVRRHGRRAPVLRHDEQAPRRHPGHPGARPGPRLPAGGPASDGAVRGRRRPGRGDGGGDAGGLPAYDATGRVDAAGRGRRRPDAPGQRGAGQRGVAAGEHGGPVG